MLILAVICAGSAWVDYRLQPPMYRAEAIASIHYPTSGRGYSADAYNARQLAVRYSAAATSDSVLQQGAQLAGSHIGTAALRREVVAAEVPNSPQFSVDVTDRRPETAQLLDDAVVTALLGDRVAGEPAGTQATVVLEGPPAIEVPPVWPRTAAAGAVGLLVGVNAAALLEIRRRKRARHQTL
ncbi:MAG TPA: hypothetical protein VMW11_06440 [Candidatus Dormibacteraeota bacterium]|nr:hypothetical protein [Candidatus Dormibacteraeota bacterium]